MSASGRDWAASGANRQRTRAAAESGLTMGRMLTSGRRAAYIEGNDDTNDVLTLMLLAALPAGAAAAQAKPAPARQAEAAPVAAPAAPDERTARETRERLREIFEQYPPSVAQVLRLDPSLLTRPDYLALYPTLAAFLAQHPEVAHNPVFFLGGVGGGQQYADSRPASRITRSRTSSSASR